MPEADDGTVSTNVLLQIAQILVLRMPIGGMQIITSKWMKKFLISEDRKKVEEFLPLFILSLKQQTLVEPFESAPFNSDSKKWDKFPCDKQEFTQSDIKKSLKEDRLWEKNAPPYKIDISRDLMEYAAYQEIPNFGAHFYYAFSLEPLPKWQNFNKFRVPRKMIPSLTVEYADSTPDYDSSEELTTPETLEASVEPMEAAEVVPGSITTSHVTFDPLIVQSVQGIPPVLERLLETSINELSQAELDRTAQELERSERIKGIPERLHKYMRDLPPSSPALTSSPALMSPPALTRSPATVSSSALMRSPSLISPPVSRKTPATRRTPAVKRTPAARRSLPFAKTPAVTKTPATKRTLASMKTPAAPKKTPVPKKSPVAKKTPVIIIDEPSSVAETEDTDVDDTQNQIIEDRVTETMRRIALASQSPMCKTRAQELKSKLDVIKTRKEQALLSPEVVIEPTAIEQLDIYQLPAEFLDASERIRSVTQMATTEMERLKINQTPDLVMSDFIVTATDQVGHQFLDAFHSTDYQLDFKSLAITAVEILDLTIDNRNRIQMAASPVIIVDSEVTRQLEDIRENIADTEQLIDDEFMDESGISEEENSANKSQILEHINEAIAICEEEQSLLDTSFPEDETSAKFISLLSNNNSAAIKELVNVQESVLIDFESDLPTVTASDQIDIKNTALTALEILDETIDNRNRIQMLASPTIIVDPGTTQILEEIRENIAETEENMETADEITDESGNSEEENSANLSQILEQINEAIAVCKEEQVLLETSIPEDETSVKFVSLLSNSNNSAIEELEDVINQSSDSITGDFLANDQAAYKQIDYHEKLLDVLNKAIDDRNRIQLNAGTSITVDPNTTRQLQGIRETVATADHLLPTTLTESEVKYFKKLQKILKIIQKIIDVCSNADMKLEKQMKGKTSKEYSDYSHLSHQFIAKMEKLLFEINDSNPKDQNYPTLIGDLIEQASDDMETYIDNFEDPENKYIQDNQDKKLDNITNNLGALNKNIESFQDESPIFLAELERTKNNKILEAVTKVMVLVKEENAYLESINQNVYATMLSESNNDTIEELEYVQDVLSVDPKNVYE